MSKNQRVKGSNYEIQLEDHESTAYHNFGGKLIYIVKFTDVKEKEMATHSSVLAWRIPGMGEPGGLPSMGSHRVRHN